MAVMNDKGYVVKTHRYGKNGLPQDLWFVYHPSVGNFGIIHFHSISVPKEYIGKRVRIKIELAEDKTMEEL